MWRRKVVAEFTSAVKNRTPDPPPPEEELTVSDAREIAWAIVVVECIFSPTKLRMERLANNQRQTECCCCWGLDRRRGNDYRWCCVCDCLCWQDDPKKGKKGMKGTTFKKEK
jgi:hypothetical protein